MMIYQGKFCCQKRWCKTWGPLHSLPAGEGCFGGTCLPQLLLFLWMLPQLKAWVNEPVGGEDANGEPKLPASLMSRQRSEHLPLLQAGTDPTCSKKNPHPEKRGMDASACRCHKNGAGSVLVALGGFPTAAWSTPDSPSWCATLPQHPRA